MALLTLALSHRSMVKTVVAFNITRSRGASEVEVMEQVDKELAALTASMGNIQVDKVL